MWFTNDHFVCAAPPVSLPHARMHIRSQLSVSLHVSCSLLTVRCVNTSYASSKALRLAEVQPNYLEYYLEDTVMTVRPSVTWLR